MGGGRLGRAGERLAGDCPGPPAHQVSQMARGAQLSAKTLLSKHVETQVRSTSRLTDRPLGRYLGTSTLPTYLHLLQGGGTENL